MKKSQKTLDFTLGFWENKTLKKFSPSYCRSSRQDSGVMPEEKRAIDYRSYLKGEIYYFIFGAGKGVDSPRYKNRLKVKVYFYTFFPQSFPQKNYFFISPLLTFLSEFIRINCEALKATFEKGINWCKGNKVGEGKTYRYMSKRNKKGGRNLPGTGTNTPRDVYLSKTKEREHDAKNPAFNTAYGEGCPLWNVEVNLINRIRNQKKEAANASALSRKKSNSVREEITHEKFSRFAGHLSTDGKCIPTV